MSEDTTISEDNTLDRKSDRWVDALSAVILVSIFVTTLAYWISSQS